MGCMNFLVIIKCHPASDIFFRLPTCFPDVQENVLLFQRPTQTRDEDVVDAASLAAHRNSCIYTLHEASTGKKNELDTLISVHDIGYAEA